MGKVFLRRSGGEGFILINVISVFVFVFNWPGLIFYGRSPTETRLSGLIYIFPLLVSREWRASSSSERKKDRLVFVYFFTVLRFRLLVACFPYLWPISRIILFQFNAATTHDHPPRRLPVKTLIPLIRFSVAFFPFPGWLVGWMLNHFVNGWMQVWEPNENHFPAAVDYYCYWLFNQEKQENSSRCCRAVFITRHLLALSSIHPSVYWSHSHCCQCSFHCVIFRCLVSRKKLNETRFPIKRRRKSEHIPCRTKEEEDAAAANDFCSSSPREVKSLTRTPIRDKLRYPPTGNNPAE